MHLEFKNGVDVFIFKSPKDSTYIVSAKFNNKVLNLSDRVVTVEQLPMVLERLRIYIPAEIEIFIDD
jgi:hypothetical protein